jgi:hypothetical protein
MKLLALSLTLLAAVADAKAAPKSKVEAAPPTPEAALAKTHGGRVWATDAPAPPGGEALRAWLAGRPGTATLARAAKDGPWTGTYVAVFKKPAAPGPVTVKFFDKKDPRSLVDESSSDTPAATLVHQGTYELDPDHGFNTGHTYLLKVGQIIKGKFQPYASGEVTLK